MAGKCKQNPQATGNDFRVRSLRYSSFLQLRITLFQNLVSVSLQNAHDLRIGQHLQFSKTANRKLYTGGIVPRRECVIPLVHEVSGAQEYLF